MPGGMEFSGKRDHEGPGQPVHQGHCSDAVTEAQVVACTAWLVSMAVSLAVRAALFRADNARGAALFVLGSVVEDDRENGGQAG